MTVDGRGGSREVEHTGGGDGQGFVDSPARCRQPLGRGPDRVVFDRTREHDRPRRTSVERRRIKQRAEREIQGFGASTGEHDLAGPTAKERGHRVTRRLQGFTRVTGNVVNARRVPEAVAQHGNHGVDGARVHRCGCRVIEIVHWSSGRSGDQEQSVIEIVHGFSVSSASRDTAENGNDRKRGSHQRRTLVHYPGQANESTPT